MNDREKLIDVLTEVIKDFSYFNRHRIGIVADHLIANGVVIQKQGEWIYQEDDDNYMYRCSNCRHGIIFRKDTCPSCGAKMKEVK